MLFDINNLFFHTGSAYAFTAGEFVSLAALTASGLASTVIDMTVAQDPGIGDGVAIPRIAVKVGTGITSASTGLRLNWQAQGSTDSTNWTTYAETGANATSSFEAGEWILPIAWPRQLSTMTNVSSAMNYQRRLIWQCKCLTNARSIFSGSAIVTA